MRVQPATFKAYDGIIRGYLRPGRGHLRIGDLTVRQLGFYLIQPLQQGGLRGGSLRRSRVEYARAILRQSLGEAVSDALRDDNVATLLASLHTTSTASAAPTRTPTGCSASTYPAASTSAPSPTLSSTPSPPNSTNVLAKRSAG